jgi:probable F420-dependent oxidoreductase
MQVGIAMFVTDYSIDVVSLAQKAEACGFDSVWLPEHPIIPVHTTTPFPGAADGVIPPYYAHAMDPFVALAAAAAVTSKLKLGTGICLVPERNPLHTAKEIATLDQISGGRFIFGIGAGWLKEETEIFGANFPRRWGVTREAVLAMKALWTQDEAEFHGDFIDFPAVKSYPKPVQKPHPPILLGGAAKNVLQRVVAYGDGWMPTRLSPERLQENRNRLNELATAAGRDPATLPIRVFGAPNDADAKKRYEDAGAQAMVILLPPTKPDEAVRILEDTAQRLIA